MTELSIVRPGRAVPPGLLTTTPGPAMGPAQEKEKSMNNETHTPTPWKASHYGEGEYRRDIVIDCTHCGQIADVLDAGNGKANAEFIALAVNCHHDLLEASADSSTALAAVYQWLATHCREMEGAAVMAAMCQTQQYQNAIAIDKATGTKD